jgi:hypothetical protein
LEDAILLLFVLLRESRALSFLAFRYSPESFLSLPRSPPALELLAALIISLALEYLPGFLAAILFINRFISPRILFTRASAPS